MVKKIQVSRVTRESIANIPTVNAGPRAVTVQEHSDCSGAGVRRLRQRRSMAKRSYPTSRVRSSSFALLEQS